MVNFESTVSMMLWSSKWLLISTYAFCIKSSIRSFYAELGGNERYYIVFVAALGEVLIYQVEVLADLLHVESQIPQVVQGERGVAIRCFQVEAQGL